jgi:uncharacterized membrane protein
MATVTESVDVAVPVSTAYNQWTQFESFPHFMNGVDSITQLDETHNHWRTTIGGVAREFDTEIVEQIPDTRIAWRSTDGTSHAGSVSFQSLGERESRVTVELEWTPANLTEKVGAAAGIDDRQVGSDLKRFKQYIEEQGHPDGAWRGSV